MKSTNCPEAIKLFVKEFELKHSCKIVYLIETGSRAMKLDTADSDYDIKGFFTYEPLAYLKLKRPDVYFTKTHHFVAEYQKEFELDYALWELGDFLKIVKHDKFNDYTCWLISQTIYIDLTGDIKTFLIRNTKDMAILPFNGRLKKIQYTLKEKNTIFVKHYMQGLTFTLLIFHILLEGKAIPNLNFWEEAVILKSVQKSPKHEIIVEKIVDLMTKLYELKKSNRKALLNITEIDKDILEFQEDVIHKASALAKLQDGRELVSFGVEEAQAYFEEKLKIAYPEKIYYEL